MDRIEPHAAAGVTREKLETIASVHERWNEALRNKDVDAAIALYAPDTVLESPLVRHLIKSKEGIVRGREKLREFVTMVFANQPASRRTYRKGFFTDGHTLMWEYPRAAPDGDQMDFVEVMEIENGLIAYHRVYWGWYGLRILEENRHH